MDIHGLTAVITWFDHMVASYSSRDHKLMHNLKLKYIHSKSTMEKTEALAQSLDLCPEYIIIAKVIGLLHDSGRFPQYFHYRTFRDSQSENHATSAVRMLKEEKVLESWDSQAQDWVYTAIQHHNAYQLPPLEDENGKLFAHIIRDADKLDIYQIMSHETFDLGLTPHGNPSPAIMQAIRNKKCAHYSHIQHETDFKLLQLSWVFDLQFDFSRSYLMSKGLWKQFQATLPKSPTTEEAIHIIENYLKESISLKVSNE